MTFARCRFQWAAYVPRCKNRGFVADLSRRSPFCPTFPSASIPLYGLAAYVSDRGSGRVRAIFCRLPRSTARDARCGRGLRPDARSVGEWHDRGYIPPDEALSLLQQPCSSPSSTVNQHRTVPKESRSMPLLSVCLSATRAVSPRTTTDSLRRLFPSPLIPNFALTGRRGSAWQTQSPPHIQFGGKTHPSIRVAASLVPFS